MPGGVPMSWMVKWPGDFPVFVEHAAGRSLHVRRRHRPRRSLPRRHRRDDGPLPRPDRRGGDPAARPAGSRRCSRPRTRSPCRRAGRAVRPALLAVHADRHRRQPTRDPLRPAPHRPQQGRRAQLVLPRLGRRGVRDARRRTAEPRTGRSNIGAPVDTSETTRVVEFNDLDGARAGPRRTATWQPSSSSRP